MPFLVEFSVIFLLEMNLLSKMALYLKFVYWPNMNADKENFIRRCEICSAYRPDQPKEPMISHEIPNETMGKSWL